MIEVEVKVSVDDFTPVREALKKTYTSFVGYSRDDDMYFSHPCRDFKNTDEALRIRNSSSEGYVVTYKGPRFPGSTKSRVEVNMKTEDLNNFLQILKHLGFEFSAHVAKLRETWKIRDVSISLDDVEGLGKFVEVEVNVDNALEAEDAEGIINSFLQDLGLYDKPIMRESYLELIAKNGVKS